MKKTVPVDPAKPEQDRSLILKVCYLVVTGQIPHALMDDALEAIRHHSGPVRNKPAFFHDCLQEALQQRGDNLNKLLAVCEREIPREALTGEPGSKST